MFAPRTSLSEPLTAMVFGLIPKVCKKNIILLLAPYPLSLPLLSLYFVSKGVLLQFNARSKGDIKWLSKEFNLGREKGLLCAGAGIGWGERRETTRRREKRLQKRDSSSGCRLPVLLHELLLMYHFRSTDSLLSQPAVNTQTGIN